MIPFPTSFTQDAISHLKQQFQKRISDLDEHYLKIRLFESRFHFAIEDLPIDLEIEIIDLQSNDILKEKFKERNLIEFYKTI